MEKAGTTFDESEGVSRTFKVPPQGYLADKKQPPPSTLQ